MKQEDNLSPNKKKKKTTFEGQHNISSFFFLLLQPPLITWPDFGAWRQERSRGNTAATRKQSSASPSTTACWDNGDVGDRKDLCLFSLVLKQPAPSLEHETGTRCCPLGGRGLALGLLQGQHLPGVRPGFSFGLAARPPGQKGRGGTVPQGSWVQSSWRHPCRGCCQQPRDGFVPQSGKNQPNNGSRLHRGQVAVFLFCNPFIQSVFHSLTWSCAVMKPATPTSLITWC